MNQNIKGFVKSAISSTGFQLIRKDPSLPILHSISLDDLSFPFWLTNSHAKSWWFKPALDFNAEFKFIKQCCKPGTICFDIGAHHGIQTIPMAMWAGATSKVFAFEANKGNAITLGANINLNQLHNTVALYAAAGSQTGEINISGESVSDNNDNSTLTPCYALDNFCDQHAIEQVDFLKIDVEGFEIDVLNGAQRLLGKVPHISLELHIDDLIKYGGKVEQLVQLLSWHSYEITLMDRSKSWNQTRQIETIADLPSNGIVNLFFKAKAPN